MIIKQNALKFPRPFEQRTSTDSFIFHHAAAVDCTIEDIHRWHLERGWNGIGYNFVIYKNGDVYEGRPIWAADADAWGHNYDSISACFVGDFDKEFMTPQAVKSGVDLLRYARMQYKTIKRAFRHKDVNNDTACPGKNFEDKIIIAGMATEIIETWQAALKKLVDSGAIKSPEYWEKVVSTTHYVDQLLISFANKLSEFENK